MLVTLIGRLCRVFPLLGRVTDFRRAIGTSPALKALAFWRGLLRRRHLLQVLEILFAWRVIS
ncbi:hypothetical protein PQ610_03700 [Tardisphaera miroshnichenkoae]